MGASQILGGRGLESVTAFNAARQFYQGMAGLDVEGARRKLEADKDALTVEMGKMQEARARAIANGEALATPALAGFAGVLTTTIETVDRFSEAIKAAISALGGPKIPQTLRQSGQAAPGTVPGVAPSEASSAWDAVGVPGRSGTKGPRSPAMPFDTSGIQQYALGGITDGISIAGERGPEAVVPLPDGRTIPVNIQSMDSNYGAGGGSSSSNNAMTKVFQEFSEFFRNQKTNMQTNTSTLESILTVLRDSYDTQDRLLTNSY
jgi:hypothetical protein